jgi:hypothetical protein
VEPKHAVIRVEPPPGKNSAGTKPVELPVLFNPTEFALNKGAQVAEIPIPGLDTPLLQFVRGQTETLTVDLFFDTTDGGTGDRAKSVTEHTDKIYDLLKIRSDRHAPPVCTFVWGKSFPGCDISDGNQKRTSFKGVVESVKQRFTLFSTQGIPLRATVTVTFKEFKPLDQQLKELNLNSPDRTQAHVVERNDTLSAIAGRQYQRPGEWRQIAEDNDIDDPRRLTIGRTLRVPPLL